MRRQGLNLGCILLGVGALLSCCLLPYLVSSIYSIVTAVLEVPAAPEWLWGTWINALAGESDILYMLLAEGPICCVGAIGLLIVILGLVLAVSGRAQEAEAEDGFVRYEEEEFAPYGIEEQYPDTDQPNRF